MKKLLLSAFGLSMGMTAFAQLPVSQSAENRHAVLEEFTGINCQFCPDGHAVGNTLSAANPGTFHKIHIHAGSYANTTPDLRTTEGTSIANNSGLSGYPAGGINRQGTNWGVGRGNWTNLTNTVTAQSSHVNVAVEGSVNSATRLLTVDAEVFYTNLGAAASTEYLVVALVQNNIPGPQIDAGNYNPTGWKCQPTVYKHMEVLRDLVNTGGTTGDPITPTAGVISRQYTMTLPASISGVDLELGELALVAYIKDVSGLTGSSAGTIITGNSGPVNVTGANPADMSAAENHTAPAGLCDNQFTPMITVTNNSSSSITGIDVTYYLNGTPTTVNLPTQTIAASGTFNYSFPQTTLNSGSNEIEYEVTLTDATKDDLSPLNNTSCPDFINVMPTGTFGTQHTEGFESMSLGDDTPANAILVEPNDIRAYVVNQGVSGSVTWNIGGYGNSANSYRYDFWAIANGETSEIIWEKLDFSGSGSYQMSFDVSYKQYNGSNDRIEVYASTDCGQNWAQVFFEQGSTLASGNPANNSSRHYPANGGGDWHTKIVNLSAYNGQSEVMLRMKGTSANGNSCYIDNINISTSVGVEEEVVSENTVDIYPNPTNDISTISFTLNETALVSLDVYNAMGALVFKKGTESMNSGIQKIAFDGTELPAGMYFVNLTVGDKVITKKVSILK